MTHDLLFNKSRGNIVDTQRDSLRLCGEATERCCWQAWKQYFAIGHFSWAFVILDVYLVLRGDLQS